MKADFVMRNIMIENTLGVDNLRLNIGIIIPFLEKYGGAERYLIECVRHWQYQHDITIYAVSINRNLLNEHNILTHVKLVELTPYFKEEHSMLLNAILLPKLWRDEIGQHDIYHTHLWPTHLIDKNPMVWFPHEPLRVLHDLRFEQDADKLGDEIGRKIHIYPKYNYDRIGSDVYGSYLTVIDKMDQTGHPDRIVANSYYTAKYLEEVYQRPVTNVVYPGIEPELFFDLPIDRNLFVTVSQLWSHKRVNLLIEAIALTDNTQLVIIGSGPEQNALSSLIKKYGLEDRIFIVSGLSNRELSLLLSRTCAFLFAAIREPFGIVILEAMAAGKPIIAVNQGGYTEICNEQCSFLVPPTPSAFAEKITYLQQHPEIGIEMGKIGKTISTKYTWKKTAEELGQILIETHSASKKHQIKIVDNKKIKTLFGIQYYCWFGEGFGSTHWNDNVKSGFVSDKPILGYYGSSKGETINYHLSLFEEMGLDFVILNLHVDQNSVNGLELLSIQHLFDIAERKKAKIRFAIQIAPYVSDNIDRVLTVVAMLEKMFSRKSNYLVFDKKPVLFWFWTGSLDTNNKLISALKEASKSFTNIAIGLRIPDLNNEQKLTFGWFDGFIPFSPLELAAENNWTKVWNKAYDNARYLGMTCLGATVSPGYDDSELVDELRTNNPYRAINRRNGEVYEQSFKFIENLSVKPNMVIISTFNEYHENSHIEPSLRHGSQYIDMTTKLINKLCLQWSQECQVKV